MKISSSLNRERGLKGFISEFSAEEISERVHLSICWQVKRLLLCRTNPGTTTDPVTKTVEIFGIGPATLIDTAGIDDLSTLGSKRFKKSIEAIKKVDCAILLIAGNQFGSYEIDLIRQFEKSNVPYLIVHNKSDISKIATYTKIFIRQYTNAKIIDFSTLHPTNKEELIEAIKEIIPENVYQQNVPHRRSGKTQGYRIAYHTYWQWSTPRTYDSTSEHDYPWCVGQSLHHDRGERDRTGDFLKLNIKPTLAITDSRVFDYVAKILPEEIPLTSFSIVFARMKGDFDQYINRNIPNSHCWKMATIFLFSKVVLIR